MPSRPSPALAVVVPVHDEAANIEPLLAEISAALTGRIDFEAVFVDDGSSDDTLAELLRCAHKYPTLAIVRHHHNCGQSTAIHTGVRLARAPLVATLDGDGQNDPADIPVLLQRWQQEKTQSAATPLLIAGRRTRRRDTWVRRLSSRIANGVRSRLLGDNTPDTGCGLKLFSREDFLALPYFDHMHRFLPALFQRMGGRVLSVPVRHRPRQQGKSHYGIHNRLWVGLVDLLGVIWLKRRARVPVVELLLRNGENPSGT
ncbi:MAG: glycosyltransferase family 2 protein [Pseudomonadota bacterium]|jgi:dolichol-phosphate mannosyltransferase